MIAVERHFKPHRINDILNDALVRPDIADMSEGKIDVSKIVADQNNVCLVGEHGATLFARLMPGVYEVHTAVLREGRGSWIYGFAREVTNWVYTRTEAFEIVTRIPAKHLAARHLARKTGMRHEFTRPNETVWRGQKQDIDIYSFRIQDWASEASEYDQPGRAFHDFLHGEARRLKVVTPAHEDDEQHNRVVGIALTMVEQWQVHKGIGFYNRWAVMSRHAPLQLVKLDPVIVKFDIGFITFENGTRRVDTFAEAA